MSPLILSTGLAAPDWIVDRTWPIKPIVPTAAGAGVGASVGYVRYPFGANSDTTWDFAAQRGSHSGGGAVEGRTTGGTWAVVADGVAGAGNAGVGYYVPQWRPAIGPATAPPDDDPAQRIAWFKIWVLESAAQATPAIADSLGFQVLPDDGLAFSSATWPVAGSGGFGIFRRVGNDGYRYASYSGAPALIDSFNLAGGGAGWHAADFIIRQARFNDATTPWLTFRWDGVEQFRERPFGAATLATPQSIRANAHGWAFYFGLFPTDTGEMGCRARFRLGRFHPDGFVQP